MKLLVLFSLILVVNAAPQRGYIFLDSQGSFDTTNVRVVEPGSSFEPPLSQQEQPLSISGASLPTTSHSGTSAQDSVNQSGISNQQPRNEQPINGDLPNYSSNASPQPATGTQLTHQNIPSVKPQSTDLLGKIANVPSHQSSRAFESDGDCPHGQIRYINGICVTPEVTRNVFVYAAPETVRPVNVDTADIPLPKVEHNIVFIRTDKLTNANDPIIVPPPQKKDFIYILNKELQVGGRRVIEVTTPKPKEPEVYFINYGEGQNPVLHGGIDFETALNSAVEAEGQVIDGSSGFSVNNEHNSINFPNSGVSSGFNNEASNTGFHGNFVSGSTTNTGSHFNGQEYSFNTGTPLPIANEVTNAVQNINSESGHRSNFNDHQFTVNHGISGFSIDENNALYDTNSANAFSSNVQADFRGKDFSENVESAPGPNKEIIVSDFGSNPVSNSQTGIESNVNKQEYADGDPLPTINGHINSANTATSPVQYNYQDGGSSATDNISINENISTPDTDDAVSDSNVHA